MKRTALLVLPHTEVGLFGRAVILATLILFGCDNTPTVGPFVTTTPHGGTPTSAVPTAARPPVVLIHGWKGSANPLQIMLCPSGPPTPATPPPSSEVEMDGLEQTIIGAGYPIVVRAWLWSSPCYTPRMADNIPLLKSFIADAKKKSGASKVILVAHSMGGVIAREYIEGPGVHDSPDKHYENDVCALFTIGSPHEGVNLSARWLGLLFAPKGMRAEEFQARQEVMIDFQNEEMANYNGNGRSRTPGVQYFFVGGELTNAPRTIVTRFLDFLRGPISADGFIPTSSSLGLNLNGSIQRLAVNEAHSEGFSSKNYFSGQSEAQSYIGSVLEKGITCTVDLSTPVATSPPTPLPPTSTVQTTCNASQFADMVHEIGTEKQLDYSQGSDGQRLVDLYAQYLNLCASQGIKAKDLVAVSQVHGLSILAQEVDAPGVDFQISDLPGQTPNLTAAQKLQRPDAGYAVVKVTDQQQVLFYLPSLSVQATSRADGAIGITRTLQTLEGDRFNAHPPVQVVPRGTLIGLSAKDRPTLDVDPNGDGLSRREVQAPLTHAP